MQQQLLFLQNQFTSDGHQTLPPDARNCPAFTRLISHLWRALTFTRSSIYLCELLDVEDFGFLEADFDAALAFGLASAAPNLCGDLDRASRIGERPLSGDCDLSLRDAHRWQASVVTHRVRKNMVIGDRDVQDCVAYPYPDLLL